MNGCETTRLAETVQEALVRREMKKKDRQAQKPSRCEQFFVLTPLRLRCCVLVTSLCA